jgi:uncharacterized protein YecE (DUF72 family)
MKFGKLSDITNVDFALPNDHSNTKHALSKGSESLKIYQGGTMWNIPDWIGRIFPEKTPKKDLMKAYGSAFSTIELNATHYKIPTKEVVRNWYEAMPSDFIFCPKFPQLISHYRRFKNCEGLTDEFLEAILELKEKLSFSFIQLPPNFAAQHSEALATYLRALPRDMKFALEFRHESWFEPNERSLGIWKTMEECGIASVITDTAGRRDAVHMRLTSPHCIVRFGGNELHTSDTERLEAWVDRVVKWKDEGLEEFQLWIHQPDSILTPETSQIFAGIVKRKLGLIVKAPVISQKLF